LSYYELDWSSFGCDNFQTKESAHEHDFCGDSPFWGEPLIETTFTGSPNELDYVSNAPAATCQAGEVDKTAFDNGSFEFNLTDEPLLPARLPALNIDVASPTLFEDRIYSPLAPVVKLQDDIDETEPMDDDDIASSAEGTHPSEETESAPLVARLSSPTVRRSAEPVPPSLSRQVTSVAPLQYGVTKKGVPRRKPGRKSKAEKAALPERMPPRGMHYPASYRHAFIKRYIEKRRRLRENPTGPLYKYEVRRDFAVRRPRIGGRFISKEAMEAFDQAQQ